MKKILTGRSLSPFACLTLDYSRVIISAVHLSGFACAAHVMSLLLCRNVLPAGGGECSASCVFCVSDGVRCCVKRRTYQMKSYSAASKITSAGSVSAIV